MTERYFAAANTGVVTEVSQKDYEEQLMSSDDVVFLTETELRELRGFIDRALGAPAPDPGTLFWTVMVKRNDGVTYADLHKVQDLEFHLTEEDADRVFGQMHPEVRESYHVVALEARLHKEVA